MSHVKMPELPLHHYIMWQVENLLYVKHRMIQKE